MSHQPRPYQNDAINALVQARKKGTKRALVTMPTGTGKTQVFSWALERLGREKPALILAHRDELIQQAASRIKALLPDVKVGIEAASERAPRDSQIVVASVQTIGRKDSSRLHWFTPHTIVIDEAHHAPADTYRRILDRYPKAFVVGVTATPHRSQDDKRQMSQVWEEEVYRYDFHQAIRDGFLCDIRAYCVRTDTDITGVATRQGDFAVGTLEQAINTEARTREVIGCWQEVAQDRRTVVYCAGVEHAHQVAALWRQAGFTAEAVDGSMSIEDRRAVLDRFHTGETQVITNCLVLTEGFDLPAISCVVMLRPTQSSILYMQCVGRGTRIAQGKQDLIVIDVVDNYRRSKLITAPCLLGLPSHLVSEGETLTEMAAEVQALGAKAAAIMASEEELSLSDVRLKLQAVNLLMAHPLEVVSSLAWVSVPAGFYLSCGQGRTAMLTTDALGHYHLTLEVDRSFVLHSPLDTDDVTRAAKQADRIVLDTWRNIKGLVSVNAPWRQEPPTEKQLKFLRYLGHRNLDGITKGQACSMIAAATGGR